MYAIGIIIVGVVLLAIVLIFIFGISGQGVDVLGKLFGTQSNAAADASQAVNEFTGKFFQK